MKNSITVIDDFCEQIIEARNSALEAGFGTWKPNKGEVGSSNYDGMNFWGRHSLLLKPLAAAFGRPVFPNNMFFRCTRPETEKAYIHSDRMWGTHTAIVYASIHKEVSGTGFYRHRETGLTEMPTFEEMKAAGTFDMFKADMVSGDDSKWEQVDFVRGLFNRALISHAPLFHSRFPKDGLGDSDETGRIVWAAHFCL